MGRRGNGVEKRNIEGKKPKYMRRQPLVQKLCAEMTASLTPLPLPSQYYQNTNSSCKQKKNHYDAWSEDVLNHIQAATQKRVPVLILLRNKQERSQCGADTEKA